MWNYYSYYPYGTKTTFSLAGRANELFNNQNPHGHHHNYSVHKGFGESGQITTTYQERAVKEGHAVTRLPHASHNNSPYMEMFWSPPGEEAGSRRLIVNQNDPDEIYFTDNHYNVYWKVFAAQSTHTIFPP
jgi:hypothetical protein